MGARVIRDELIDEFRDLKVCSIKVKGEISGNKTRDLLLSGQF
jgi:hypothetical protein